MKMRVRMRITDMIKRVHVASGGTAMTTVAQEASGGTATMRACRALGGGAWAAEWAEGSG